MILRYFTVTMTASVLLLMHSSTQAQAVIPAAVKPCLRQLNPSRTPVSQVVTQGIYREGAKSYYLLSLYPVNLDVVRDAAKYRYRLESQKIKIGAHTLVNMLVRSNRADKTRRIGMHLNR